MTDYDFEILSYLSGKVEEIKVDEIKKVKCIEIIET